MQTERDRGVQRSDHVMSPGHRGSRVAWDLATRSRSQSEKRIETGRGGPKPSTH